MEGLLPRLKLAETVPVEILANWEERCRVARELFRRDAQFIENRTSQARISCSTR
jgi:hypothetical protein